ncbi:MAG: D-alanyl-D-alanine carboxypeptidase [Clostridia bacterium]|nr:D-alanyl-D-alanine carboxypeptidase [Clostridia bacterium]
MKTKPVLRRIRRFLSAGCVLIGLARWCVAAWGAPSKAVEPPPIDPPLSVSVSASSAFLMEAVTGRELYAKDADTPRPMASTTKLMTALIAAETLDSDDTVTATEEAVRVEGSAVGLHAGDTLTVRDLVTGLMLASGNDAANLIALTVSGSLPAFAERMNERARQIGMENTTFVTPSGLDADGHRSTARDMARLAAEVLQNEWLSEICAMKSATITVSGRQATLTNHNRLLSLYDGCVGLKTGFTEAAGRCLVSAATRDGVTLIAVTLRAPNDWNDHMTLFDAGFSRVRWVPAPEPELPALPVAGGVTGFVGVAMNTRPYLLEDTLASSAANEVAARVYLPPFVWAPVAAGQPVGRVEYRMGNTLVGSAVLTAASSADARPRAAFWQRFRSAWLALFAELVT